jgi:hypothetical protein
LDFLCGYPYGFCRRTSFNPSAEKSVLCLTPFFQCSESAMGNVRRPTFAAYQGASDARTFSPYPGTVPLQKLLDRDKSLIYTMTCGSFEIGFAAPHHHGKTA